MQGCKCEGVCVCVCAGTLMLTSADQKSMIVVMMLAGAPGCTACVESTQHGWWQTVVTGWTLEWVMATCVNSTANSAVQPGAVCLPCKLINVLHVGWDCWHPAGVCRVATHIHAHPWVHMLSYMCVWGVVVQTKQLGPHHKGVVDQLCACQVERIGSRQLVAPEAVPVGSCE